MYTTIFVILAVILICFLFFKYYNFSESASSANNLRPGCKGDDCSCKKGNPCLGKLLSMRKQVEENGDETYFCPICDKKSFALAQGDPYGLVQEYKCECGHWGWLHY